MRTYQIFLKPTGDVTATRTVEHVADDLNLDTSGNENYWNFVVFGEEDDVTVAAFPFSMVGYIVSQPIADAD